MDRAVVIASRTGVEMQLWPAAWPWPSGRGERPTWDVRVRDEHLQAQVLCPEQAGQSQSLAEFFAHIASDWRGWQRERRWGSVENEVRLVATHNGLNTVVLDVELSRGFPMRWQCRAELDLDPPAFVAIAAETRRLGLASLAL